jgi:hypothetical protein
MLDARSFLFESAQHWQIVRRWRSDDKLRAGQLGRLSTSRLRKLAPLVLRIPEYDSHSCLLSQSLTEVADWFTGNEAPSSENRYTIGKRFNFREHMGRNNVSSPPSQPSPISIHNLDPILQRTSAAVIDDKCEPQWYDRFIAHIDSEREAEGMGL